ncbi:MAG: hypothetical protein AVDCRST_MAG19-3994, partial [uncultured Thermomicrobiales bacterium]
GRGCRWRSDARRGAAGRGRRATLVTAGPATVDAARIRCPAGRRSEQDDRGGGDGAALPGGTPGAADRGARRQGRADPRRGRRSCRGDGRGRVGVAAMGV